MKKTSILSVILIALAVSRSFSFSFEADTTTLKPKAIYGKEARVMSYILDNNHYRKIHLNDSLSSSILDAYIKELDNSKTYFLKSDIDAFEKYRKSIDDYTRNEDVSPAYEIYNVFRKRYKERMDYVMNTLINQNFDFTAKEYYETDRDKEAWATSEAELNDTWRKSIKSQMLSLKLADKNPGEIKDTMKKRYERFAKSVAQFNSEDVFSIYMNSITQAYDPHTNFLAPKAADNFNQSMRLSLEGIGARLQTENDFTKVAEIIPGGPADKSDRIHAGDFIVGVAQGVEGEMVDVIGWRIDEVVKLIKGPKGTTVRLQILPSQTGVNGPSTELVLVRDKIALEDQAAKKKVINYQSGAKNMKLGVITLPSFYMDYDAYQKGDPNYTSTTRDVRKLIGELQKEGIDGLVMDLRNNGGGSLSEAIDLTGLFIKDGPVVQVRNSANKVEVLKDDESNITYGGPMIVLTNRFSASASEIFAGAIQDYQRGVIVGESTYGKGTVQTVLDLKRFINNTEDPGELKLTFQKFYRVTGSSTQNKGVIPDIAFPSAFSEKQYGESSNPSALPWDVIKSASFQKATDVNEKLLAALTKSYNDRLKTDAVLKKYVTETEELRKNLTETKISLNEEERRKEMTEEEKEKMLNANNDKIGTKITKEGEKTDVLNLDDEYLREGLLLLSEMALRRVG